MCIVNIHHHCKIKALTPPQCGKNAGLPASQDLVKERSTEHVAKQPGQSLPAVFL